MRALSPFLLFCLLCWLSKSTQGQQRIDTLLIRQWIDSAWDYSDTKPDRTLTFGRQALRASHHTYYFGELNGLQTIGEAYYTLGQLDSAAFYYALALQRARAENDNKEIGNSCTSLASIFLESGARDSSLHYYQLAINTFQEVRDSSSLCDAYLRCGNVYNTMGNHDLAIHSYLQSIRICEAIGNDEYTAYNYGSIGIVHDKQGNYPKAEEYFLKALDQFRTLNNIYGQVGAFNNLGILYKNMKDYQKSADAYAQSLILADSIDNRRGVLSAHTNLGILNVQMGLHENALTHCKIGLQLAREFQVKESISDNLNWMSRAQMGLEDYPNALINANEALILAQEVQSLEKQRDANLTLSEIYQALGGFDRSLEYFKAYTVVKDSLFNSERSKQISELQTIYETEKKNKEIQLLEKNAEIDSIRKTRLWTGLGLSLIAGFLLVYGQWMRRVRDKKIHVQEKELEVQRRKTAELEMEKVSRELDFKKQELVAKALQLARKNEFLQSLNTEVDKMRNDTDGPVADSARRISRQIRMDIESEEDWELFLASFREVHREFLDRLQQSFPTITKSEIRLACLMKMNLSAKEMAALLNITTDGVKKARYRLRKKMELGSGIDIQEYLLAFPY
ncbi:MAG TPA: tetratricopeptide repeat protein [Saprospiraceae bacterium]|nr:tetratricopeptide repeat protein [Saprospiraceae bacterium]